MNHFPSTMIRQQKLKYTPRKFPPSLLASYNVIVPGTNHKLGRFNNKITKAYIWILEMRSIMPTSLRKHKKNPLSKSSFSMSFTTVISSIFYDMPFFCSFLIPKSKCNIWYWFLKMQVLFSKIICLLFWSLNLDSKCMENNLKVVIPNFAIYGCVPRYLMRITFLTLSNCKIIVIIH
mgnify:CR=1 FL=1